MPESAKCPVCDAKVDTRGLSGHLQSHGHAEIASLVTDGSPLEQRGDANGSRVEVDQDSVIVREVREVAINDERLQRELVDCLKASVSDGGFKSQTGERRFD